MADTITFRPDEDASRALEILTRDGTPVSTAVRKKKDSSIRVAAKLVRDGKADGVVSAGNTGACMAVTKLVNTMTMMRAAAVMTRAVDASPSATARALSGATWRSRTDSIALPREPAIAGSP